MRKASSKINFDERQHPVIVACKAAVSAPVLSCYCGRLCSPCSNMPPNTSDLLYFPFTELLTADIREIHGFGSAKVRSPTVGGCMLGAHTRQCRDVFLIEFTGNYAAACVLRDLRTTSKAMGYHPPSLDLHVIMELPTDLLFEVRKSFSRSPNSDGLADFSAPTSH